MLPLWIYGIGDRKEAAGIPGLAADPWLPFVSEQEHRGERPLLILILGASIGQDSLVLCHALALHEAGRARVIPVFLSDPEIPGTGIERDHCRSAVKCLRALPGAIVARGSETDLLAALRQAIAQEAGAPAAPQPPASTIDVFYSYAHQDEPLRDELAKHLKALERSGLIHQWHDRCILPGAEWSREIDINLHTAEIVLLLVSPDFLASDYCQEIELPIALERHKRRSARVVPVILRPALWQHSELKWLAVLPKDGRPIAAWESQDAAFLNVCEGIVSLILSWKNEGTKPLRPVSAPPVPQEVERKRALDAALPTRVPLGKSAILAVMLRRLSSPGLRAVVEANLTYGIDAEEVRSEPLKVRFTADAAGKLQPRDLTLRVESPDFTPPSQVKTITVPPHGDSDPCVFLLAAAKPGELKVVLELRDQERRIASCLLGTTATAGDTSIRPFPNVVSAVFDVDGAPDAAVTQSAPPPPRLPSQRIELPNSSSQPSGRSPVPRNSKARVAALAAVLLLGLLGVTTLVYDGGDSAKKTLPPPATAGWFGPTGYRLVLPGEYTVGCSDADPACAQDELPPHQVRLSRGFLVSAHEITANQFRSAVTGPAADIPVTNVTWQQARDYCASAGGRLPTEAEWEIAARAGKPNPYYGPLNEIAWYRANSSQPMPVAGKLANSLGLHDVLGNAAEWVNDWYNPDAYASSPATDPRGPSSGTERVVRGGSYQDSADGLRVSRRNRMPPGQSAPDVGFRCVIDAR